MERVQRRIKCDRLPLAVYREVAAHLRQIKGIDVSLLEQTSLEFDHLQSQAGGLLIEYDGDLPTKETEQLESILAYYASKYNSWSDIT